MMRIVLVFIFLLLHLGLWAQTPLKAPDRFRGEGPYSQLIIRGVTLINRNGAPPMGPEDIVVEGDIIKDIRNVGFPGVPIDPDKRPQLKEGGKELDCEGMYLMPGFVDMHGHIGGGSQGADAEYVSFGWAMVGNYHSGTRQ